jgi:hypothetical protein
MRIGWSVAPIIAAVGIAAAQPSPEPGAGSGTQPPAEPPAAEPTLEPERIGAPKPPPSKPSEPITVDQLIVSSTNRIDLNFFGDISFIKVKGDDPAFAVGPLAFQVAAHLTDGLTGKTEFAMSYEDGETVLDVERAFIEYRTSRFSIAAGRTHAEFGYWNNAFHHGRWLQVTINRPRVIRFEDEGGMLQVHQVGITANYGPERGEHGMEVALGVGNGHGSNIVDIQNTSDNNAMKSVLLRVGAVGIGDDALRFGANVGIDQIAPAPVEVRPLLPDQSIFELLTGAYVALRSERLVVLGEIYNVLHRAAGQTWQITDGFLVAGYRFGKLMPYGQFEGRAGDGKTDPFYNPDAMAAPEAESPVSFVEGLVGLHYDINDWSALKLEASRREFDGGSDFRIEANWSFGR